MGKAIALSALSIVLIKGLALILFSLLKRVEKGLWNGHFSDGYFILSYLTYVLRNIPLEYDFRYESTFLFDAYRIFCFKLIIIPPISYCYSMHYWWLRI